jgi:hypothetical protein
MKRNEKPVQTMLVLSLACLLANVLFHWKVALWLTFLFGGIGIFSGYLSNRIAWVWMRLAGLLGRISNGLLLSVVFLFVLVPMAVVRRVRKKDRLTWFDPRASGNFISRDHLFTKEDLEKMW